MTRRVLPASIGVALVCVPNAILLTSRLGVAFLVPYLLAVVSILVIGTLLPRRSHPERWLFVGDLATMVAIAGAIAVSGGSHSPMLGFLVFSLAGAASRYPQRVVCAYAVVLVFAAVVACLFAINTHVDYSDLRFEAFLTLLSGMAIIVLALTRTERDYREQALIDPLTGTLNRLALMRRLEELRAQEAVDHGQLCVVVGDIDHFKNINDTRGHAVGDIVLRDLAGILRTHLRSQPSLPHRRGGVRCASARPAGRRGRADRRASAGGGEEARPEGIAVTMSFGVAASDARISTRTR